MEEADKLSSTSAASSRSISAYHRGNGTLSGGGIKKVYRNGMTFKSLKGKLDHRLGYCIIGCLFTITTVLIIFGLFHEIAYEALTEYIGSTRKLIVDSIPSSTVSPIVTTTTTIDWSNISLDKDEIIFHVDNERLDGNSSDNERAMLRSDSVEIAKEKYLLQKGNEPNEKILSFPYSEPETCLGSKDVDKEKCLTVNELDEYHDILHGSHIALWNLATVNIVVTLLLSPLTFTFNFQIIKNQHFKLFYRVVLFLTLLFMVAQSIVLINPLLSSSFMYPTIADKLFVQKLPREREFIGRVESRFACQFDYISQLVELHLQAPCIARIKNVVLLPYAVVLLIVIDYLPVLFIILTYSWNKWLKDSQFCRIARHRIELNNQRRPQSREDILKKTMEEPHFV